MPALGLAFCHPNHGAGRGGGGLIKPTVSVPSSVVKEFCSSLIRRLPFCGRRKEKKKRKEDINQQFRFHQV